MHDTEWKETSETKSVGSLSRNWGFLQKPHLSFLLVLGWPLPVEEGVELR